MPSSGSSLPMAFQADGMKAQSPATLKTHNAIRDAVVVGIPHPIFGEEIVGVIEPSGVTPPTEAEIIDHVKQRLAGYKAPRRVRIVDTIGRAPNGKVDYRRHRAESIEEFETAP